MQMEQQVSFNCEACPYPENILFKEGDCVVVTCSQDHVVPAQPVKKQTRQWAAWTRQEEESFFTALRQVGKNFEKITTRVQSKNKDQVRHYYYRLVRRMNKLLGPELCLDAKNSKDTNAAMLRWWSLLEKYSCKASKLHLKPRRFKIFIETLEHQLLKDRKKNIRKRHSQGENCSTTASTTVSNQARASGPDTRPVKKARQRRKKGSASTAAYKRWEKAAIAGVSLVADAAEHLERTGVDKVAEHVQDILVLGQKDFDPVGKDVPSLPTSSQNLFIENNTLTSMKLKLQLFPIDEGTRRALEMDNHNPHLELTLSTRKKISSVLEHLNRKWGSSSIASGELMLFPYYVQKENTVGCQKWTQDSVLSAADVYALIGSPPIFRLRYGWFSNAQHGSATFQKLVATSDILGEHNMNMNDMEEQNVESIPVSTRPTDRESNKLIDHCKDQLVSAENIAPSSMDVPTEMTGCIIVDPNKNRLESSNHAPTISLQRRETANRAIMRQVEQMDYLRLRNGTALSAGEWADSLTNISIGDLLPESSHNMDANCIDSAIPFTCDSFDAAIAAHIREHQSKSVFHPTLASHSSSIWDAEETCDGFSFQKNSVFCEKVQIRAPEACRHSSMDLVVPGTAVEEELPEDMEPMDADPANGDPMDECQSDPHNMDNSAKDLSGLTDIYWPDSLGPLDLDIPSCRYQSEDLILTDSLGGLNRLIASSLDAFQNCSFFGMDKKEPVSTIEARETASFSDYKIGSEV